MQVQFATKRGSNTFRGQFFDTYQSEKLNAQGAVNKSRGMPKTKLRQHEYGGNIGGPIIQNKLFFFANYEQQYSPSENTQDRTVLTPEAQQGIFRYTATDNSVRTINLLDLARSNGLPGTIDPYIASQLQIINGTLNQGDLAASTTLYQNTFRFINEQIPNINVYPTARVDYQAASSLAIRGVLNLHYRDLPTQPAVPGTRPGQRRLHVELLHHLDRRRLDDQRQPVQPDRASACRATMRSSTRATRWTILQSGRRERRQFPAELVVSRTPTNDVLPIPRNNPVYNISNTLTWLKGRHTMTFGGMFRRTTMYESIGGNPPAITLRRRHGRSRRRTSSRWRTSPASAQADLTHRAEPVRVPHRTHQHRGRQLLPRRGHVASTGSARRSAARSRTSAASSRRTSGA